MGLLLVDAGAGRRRFSVGAGQVERIQGDDTGRNTACWPNIAATGRSRWRNSYPVVPVPARIAPRSSIRHLRIPLAPPCGSTFYTVSSCGIPAPAARSIGVHTLSARANSLALAVIIRPAARHTAAAVVGPAGSRPPQRHSYDNDNRQALSKHVNHSLMGWQPLPFSRHATHSPKGLAATAQR